MPHIDTRPEPAVEALPSKTPLIPQWRRAGAGTVRGDRAERVRGAPEATNLFWKVTAHGTRPGHPRGLLLAWPRWERLANSIWSTQSIPGAPHDLLRVRMVPYQGECLTLPDRTEIAPGVVVGELHCNNLRLLELVRRNGNPYRAAREDLRGLARWIMQPGFDIDIRAFYGITLLGNAAARLGFTVRRRPMNLRLRLDRMFMVGLLLLYTVDGLGHLDRGTTARTYPREAWLSRRELIGRYGQGGPGRQIRQIRRSDSGATPPG